MATATVDTGASRDVDRGLGQIRAVVRRTHLKDRDLNRFLNEGTMIHNFVDRIRGTAGNSDLSHPGEGTSRNWRRIHEGSACTIAVRARYQRQQELVGGRDIAAAGDGRSELTAAGRYRTAVTHNRVWNKYLGAGRVAGELHEEAHPNCSRRILRSKCARKCLRYPNRRRRRSGADKRWKICCRRKGRSEAGYAVILSRPQHGRGADPHVDG